MPNVYCRFNSLNDAELAGEQLHLKCSVDRSDIAAIDSVFTLDAEQGLAITGQTSAIPVSPTSYFPHSSARFTCFCPMSKTGEVVRCLKALGGSSITVE